MIARIRTRSELLWYIAEHAPSGACRRAVVEGEVTVLGGFDHLPPIDRAGWVVRIQSVHDKVWLVAVYARQMDHGYHIGEIERIPWRHWRGVIENGMSIMNGDIPIQAENARRQAQEENDET